VAPDGRDRPQRGAIDRSHIGLSWFVGAFQGHPLVSHSGGDCGLPELRGLAPDDSAFVVVMVNSEQGSVLSKVVVEGLKAAVRALTITPT